MNHETLMKWPNLIIAHQKLSWLLERERAIFLAITILYYSYFYASLFKNSLIFSSSGACISSIGLLLTLKHGLISSAKNPEKAVQKHQQFLKFGSLNTMSNPNSVNPTIIALKDEYVGIILVLVGGLVNGYGGFIPLIT